MIPQSSKTKLRRLEGPQEPHDLVQLVALAQALEVVHGAVGREVGASGQVEAELRYLLTD